MPPLADHIIEPAPREPTLTAGGEARPPRGLLMIQEAILRDAATDLARIELQWAGAPSTAWGIQHGLAAVCVLDRTIRLLQAQRPALLDMLTEAVLSAPRAEALAVEPSSDRSASIAFADA